MPGQCKLDVARVKFTSQYEVTLYVKILELFTLLTNHSLPHFPRNLPMLNARLCILDLYFQSVYWLTDLSTNVLNPFLVALYPRVWTTAFTETDVDNDDLQGECHKASTTAFFNADNSGEIAGPGELWWSSIIVKMCLNQADVFF